VVFAILFAFGPAIILGLLEEDSGIRETLWIWRTTAVILAVLAYFRAVTRDG
jgi:hypothetical protein